jgi:vanillate O-demethylase monooxygenase subunit
LGGTRAIAEARPKIAKVPGGLRVTRRIENTDPAPYHLQFGHFTGTVDRYWIYDYLIPGILLMDSGVMPSEGSEEGGRSLKFRSCQALTPESETTTHYFFMQAHSFSLNDESVTESLYESVVTAFDEDRHMIEAQQKMIDSAPPSEMVVLSFDAALVQFRRAVEDAIQDELSSHT